MLFRKSYYRPDLCLKLKLSLRLQARKTTAEASPRYTLFFISVPCMKYILYFRSKCVCVSPAYSEYAANVSKYDRDRT